MLNAKQIMLSESEKKIYSPSEVNKAIYYQNDLIKNKPLLYIKFEDSDLDGCTLFASRNATSTSFYFSTTLTKVMKDNSVTSIMIGYNPATGRIRIIIPVLSNIDDILKYQLTNIFYI